MLLTGLKRAYVGTQELRGIAKGYDLLARQYRQLNTDPTFENTAVGVKPTGWNTSTVSTAVMSTAWVPPGGTKSLAQTGTTAGNSNTYVWASLPTAGNFYLYGWITLMATVHLDAPIVSPLNGPSIAIQNNTPSVMQWSDPIPNVAGTHRLAVSCQLTSNTTPIRFYLVHGGQLGAGTTYWTDVLIIDGDAVHDLRDSPKRIFLGTGNDQRSQIWGRAISNMMKEPTFEKTPVGQRPPGWNPSAGITDAYVDDHWAKSGTKSMKVAAATGATNPASAVYWQPGIWGWGVPNHYYTQVGTFHMEVEQSPPFPPETATTHRPRAIGDQAGTFNNAVPGVSLPNIVGTQEYHNITRHTPAGNGGIILGNGSNAASNSPVWWDDVLYTDHRWQYTFPRFFTGDGPVTGTADRVDWAGLPNASYSVRWEGERLAD